MSCVAASPVAGIQVAILVDVAVMVGSRARLGQMGAGRTGIVVVIRVIEEVGLGEEPALGFAGRIDPGHAGQNAGSLAFEYLLAVQIAAICRYGNFVSIDYLCLSARRGCGSRSNPSPRRYRHRPASRRGWSSPRQAVLRLSESRNAEKEVQPRV